MEHYLVQTIEKALGWDGPRGLGVEFARGTMADPRLCSRLLTPQRLLDVIMRRSLAPPQFRCFENGVELHPDAYLVREVTRRGQSLPMANMDRIGQLLKSGCTVVLDALDTFDPTMEIACRALQWWSREVVQVNTYLTTNDAAGFSLHWDDHDVVVVQLAGEKSWEVRGPSRAAPMYRDAEPNSRPGEDILWSGTMRAGDVMHIPRGYWHQATRADRGEGYSLHLTFGFVKRTGVDWLAWVADRSREREPFRHDLDRWNGPAAMTGQHRRLGEDVSRLVADYPIADYLALREQERPPPRHVATRGVFGEPAAVVCVAGFPPRVEKRGETVEVYAAGKKITFTGRAEPALTPLLSGHPVDLAELTTATGIDAAIVAGPLLKEGVCAELTEALSSGYTGLIQTGPCSNTP
ncbi:cupin [Amycolatopsis rhizosphaerae]|uniref:Cupin n=1 Tax=Amycolatopsis rhizosphaerae TaxID=2053003 RepID=A0A558B422_9PSEU|nr:cupin domain-containing protein [Amycolatopsis rhizosphaerae]TVT31259.1 cupin [Amycolatopsis rhizosphaerae]